MGVPIAGSWSISCSVWIAVCDVANVRSVSGAKLGKSACIPQCGMICSTLWNESDGADGGPEDHKEPGERPDCSPGLANAARFIVARNLHCNAHIQAQLVAHTVYPLAVGRGHPASW